MAGAARLAGPALLALAASVAAQGVAPLPRELAHGAYTGTQIRGDHQETHLLGGFQFEVPGFGLLIRGKNAVVLTDLEGTHAAIAEREGGGLPRRGLDLPAPRRRLSPEQMRERIDHALRALGQVGPLPLDAEADAALDLLRMLYCEGGVVVVRGGVEVLRCERLWLSPLDDRIVVEDAELRYLTPGNGPDDMLVVRGARLVKQGSRWTGRDLTITTCTAAEPHAALAVGEAEIIEREGQFEVRARGQTLQIGGTNLLPLPDAHVFTGDQTPFPIRRVRGGYSSKQGVEADVLLGMPWNDTGGRLHHWLTGRPADEFRGDWELGVGWIEERGAPLAAALDYRAGDLYRGRTEGFWLDDHGDDLREITTNLDGSPITAESRGLVRSLNRLQFGDSTYVDLSAFGATDPAVYSEFFGGAYRTEELPETGVYVHHGVENRLLTVGTRFSLTDFSYRSDRALADRFIEELPVVTYDWYAQPLGELPWGTPIVVDLSTELGQRRSAYDDRSTLRQSDRTFRADQLVELSAPMQWGAFQVRPYVSGRGTWYDNTVSGDSEGRMAMEAGVQIGTRLSRSWSWLGDDSDKVRHVMSPRIWFADRFFVDDDPSDFYTFDAKDQLTEQTLVRVELRNLFQRMDPVARPSEAGNTHEPRDFLFLDLAQDFWPDEDRDNGGESLGLFYYDFLVRPKAQWIPFPIFTVGVYGDLDWRRGMRTLDTELRFGPLAGITWTVEYREDEVAQGAVGLTGSTRLYERWDVFAGSLRDLDADEWLNYQFGLRRNDHDWSIAFTTDYDPYTDDTTFRVEFVPRFGGMGRGRGDGFGGMGVADGMFAAGY